MRTYEYLALAPYSTTWQESLALLQHKGVILFRLKRREPRYYPEKLVLR